MPLALFNANNNINKKIEFQSVTLLKKPQHKKIQVR